MPLVREVNRLLTAILIAFGAVALASAYWAIIGPDTILRREDNPRLVAAEAAIQRGDIVDRTGEMLVTSQIGANNTVTRTYLHPETSTLIGYSSLRYGVGGAEAAYNTILRGDSRPLDFLTTLSNELLHRPQVGTDIQITLDTQVQQAIVQAMQGQTGAVVVLAVPSGQVLGIASLPTFDPNTLDAEWEQLIQSPSKPFFNRALQGSYQPGGTLQTPLMAAALLAEQSLTNTLPDATDSVRLDELELNCAVQIQGVALTLRDAYAFACPQPFAELAETLGSPALDNILASFQFNAPLVLQGFEAPVRVEDQLNVTTSLEETTLAERALGQGLLTVTPLQMAVMAAAIINDGNAPRPYTLIAQRPPDTQNWEKIQTNWSTLPVSTQNTARQLQDLMRNAVANGAAGNAARPGIDIGGHATLAYAGEESQAWFIGFVTLPGQQAIAAAVVLENSDDPGLAADIGGAILQAAHDALEINPSSP